MPRSRRSTPRTDPSTFNKSGARIHIGSNGSAEITFSGEDKDIGKVFDASQHIRKGKRKGQTTHITCSVRKMTREERRGGNGTYSSGILMLTAVGLLDFNDHARGTTSRVVIGGGRGSRRTLESDDYDADDSGVRTAYDVG
jgi:hypothetical protein